MEKLIACDPVVGLPRVCPEWYRPDKPDLFSQMDCIGVTRALVRHRAAYEAGLIAGNTALVQTIANEERLLPMWYITPDGMEPDYDPEKMIATFLARGTCAFWADPKEEGFSILPWCSGPLYEVLVQRRLPLFLDFKKVEADDLDVVLSAFPELRLVLFGVPRLGRHRLVYPLLKRHASLHLVLSYTYSVHWGIEDLCRSFGHARWVFGMGYPEAEVGASLTGLTYAGISDDAKEAIAWGNVERLLSEVVL